MPVITTIDDLKRLHERRVPRMFYDYAESGSWTEQTFRENTTDFEQIRLRQRVAERLKMAQNTAAMLTTFNEVDGHGTTSHLSDDELSALEAFLLSLPLTELENEEVFGG